MIQLVEYCFEFDISDCPDWVHWCLKIKNLPTDLIVTFDEGELVLILLCSV